MKALVVPILRIADRWANRRIVRVATFGQGLSLLEWESLLTSSYQGSSMQVELVSDPAEARILAVHGPLTPLSWPLFLDWCQRASVGAQFIAVGAELRLTAEGYLLSSSGELSPVRMSARVAGHPPTPEELIFAVRQLVESSHV